MRITTIAETDHILFVMFCDFLFNSKYLSFWTVGDFYISRYRLCACSNSYFLAFLDNFHKFIIISLNGGFTWSHKIIQTCGFNVCDNLIRA